MFTQGEIETVEGSVFRGAAHELGTRPGFRGNVALFTDSFRGIGVAAANRLVRDGYVVKLYLSTDDGKRWAPS